MLGEERIHSRRHVIAQTIGANPGRGGGHAELYVVSGRGAPSHVSGTLTADRWHPYPAIPRISGAHVRGGWEMDSDLVLST